MRTAAIYARISSDPDGTRLGVDRQIADCENLADRPGWRVGGLYVDNDLSAWSGRTRPEYHRMLDDLKAGVVNAVVVWHADRLHRHPWELEDFITLVEAADVAVEVVTSGELDLSSPSGRAIARIFGAMARKDSDDKSLRSQRKHAELAARGKVSGGGNRPFGYEDDKITVRPAEAATVREVANRIEAGESLRSVCADLNSRGVTTATGGEWSTTPLKRILTSGRISGRREHKGEIVADAEWPPIITPAQSDRLRQRLDRRPGTGRPPRRYLLAGGLLRCGLCRSPLVSQPRSGGTRRYVCPTSPGRHGGCGRISVTADPIEALVTEAVLYRLDTPELATALTDTRKEEAQLAELHDQVAQDEAMLEQLAADMGLRRITRAEWMAARDPIQQRIDANRRRLSRLSPTTAIDDYVGHSDLLRSAWVDLPLSRQQAIIRVILDHVVANPALPGRPFDPDRFDPIWRL